MQSDSMNCGPACLKMIAYFYGRRFSLKRLAKECLIGKEGVSLLGISHAAERMGFRAVGGKLTFNSLVDEALLPCIIYWEQKHFVVLYKEKKQKNEYKLFIADPGKGLLSYSEKEFCKHWLGSKDEGFALLLEPTEQFYEQKDDKPRINKFSFLYRYLLNYKKSFISLIIGILMGNLIQLLFPFLTQAIVDIGIQDKSISFIWLILLGQFVLLLSRTIITFIRNKILLHISARINISLISDFFIKLMRLPMKFFNTKLLGDLLQRIEDHQRIEDFLTNQLLNFIFSLFTFIIFSLVLYIYNVPIFFVFLLGSVLYGVWIFIFLEKRRSLDYMYFSQQGANRNLVLQLVNGMQELNCRDVNVKKDGNGKTQKRICLRQI